MYGNIKYLQIRLNKYSIILLKSDCYTIAIY